MTPNQLSEFRAMISNANRWLREWKDNKNASALQNWAFAAGKVHGIQLMFPKEAKQFLDQLDILEDAYAMTDTEHLVLYRP